MSDKCNEEKNRLKDSLVIIGVAILFLVLVSFLPPELKIGGIDLKPLDLLSDIRAGL